MKSLLRLALLFLFCLTCSAQTYLTSPDFGSGAVTRSGLPPGAFGADPPRHFVLPGDDNLELASGFLPACGGPQPPRQVNDLDFQMVWQSESHPYGMDKVAVGDLDNDGINELATWWKQSQNDFTAYILIYKSSGDNQYELFMQEPFFMVESIPAVSYMLIDDLDQNGQKELIFTLMYCYFWEFSAPGVYHQWRSSFQFDFPVEDMKITDVDQDNIKEITQLGYYHGTTDHQSLMVEEFYFKNTADSTFFFLPIADIPWECDPMFRYWPNMAVGDFDNDDTTDIVLGSGFVFWYAYGDTLIPYYRYAPGTPDNFVQHWINPGLHAMCSNPIIADLDNDGQQELYAAGFGGVGLSPDGWGSAYVWEATGLDSGYIAWWDTTSMTYAPTGAAFALVDSVPCVINNVLDVPTSQFCLFGFLNGHYQLLWQSQLFTGVAFARPLSVCDVDQDGKISFVDGELISGAPSMHKIVEWEQISSGIEFEPLHETPLDFILYPNYPNPFNPSTAIHYQLPVVSDVSMKVYDTAGRLISTLAEGQQEAGTHQVTFDGSSLPSGVYLYRLSAGGNTATGKMVLLK